MLYSVLCTRGYVLVVVQLLLSEEKDKERPDNVEDDDDGHLVYSNSDVIRKQCESSLPWVVSRTGKLRGRGRGRVALPPVMLLGVMPQ